MAQIENSPATGRSRPGFGRRYSQNLRIDMTPMVDLGFLLISFFVITTQLSKPSAMDLYMPADGKGTELEESNALTIFLAKENRIYYYHGKWEEAVRNGEIHLTDYSASGLRTIIVEKQKRLDLTRKEQGGRTGLMLLVKASDQSTYKNVVDALDEVKICDVKKHALVQFDEDERKWIRDKEPVVAH